jgi:hypothetical protein
VRIDHRTGGARMTRIIIALFFWVFLLGPISGADAAGTPASFATEKAAQQHCPSDTVVWLNLPSGIYHLKGQRWYGQTKSGAYVCRVEADKAGDRLDRNGQ